MSPPRHWTNGATDWRAEEAQRSADYRAWATAEGYRPSSANPCPLVVAGQRHRHAGCSCDPYRATVLDHARMWLTPGRDHVLTSAPYHVDGAELVRFVAELAPLGLGVALGGWSPYHPATILVVIGRGW